MAYWVQAVGSIAAIFGAFAIGQFQLRAAKEHAEEAHRRSLASKQAASGAIVAAAYSEIETLTKIFDAEGISRRDVLRLYRVEVFSGLIASVERIPVFELEDADVSVSLLGFQNAMLSIRDLFVDFERPLTMLGGRAMYSQTLKTTELRNYIIAAHDSYARILASFRHTAGCAMPVKSPPFESK